MTEQDAINKVIQVAFNELGYKEQGKNITKYAKDFDTKWPTFYNTKKQGAEWCDIFYDWCMVTAFGEDIARQMVYQPVKSAGAGCKYSAQYYKQNNAFYSTPKLGDQIFFYVGGEINHTGRVVSINNTQVITVEGNCDNKVKQCYHDKKSSSIAGYGRPNWSLVADKKEGETVNITMPVLQKGSKSLEVGTLQTLLNALGYVGSNGKKLTVDHDFGSNCDYAVRNFQKSHGMNADGIVGAKTWNALMRADY